MEAQLKSVKNLRRTKNCSMSFTLNAVFALQLFSELSMSILREIKIVRKIRQVFGIKPAVIS